MNSHNQGEQGEQGIQGIQGVKGKMPNGVTWAFMMVTLAFVAMGIILGNDYNRTNNANKVNKIAIAELQQNKANIHQLQKSNCTLRKFLATARIARFNATKHETGPKKEIDKTATSAYTKLIVALDGKSYCPLPKNLLIPGLGN
jgi:hypothetical protein